MGITKKQKKLAEETLLKINKVTRHIRNVIDNCILLGTKLIEAGEIDLGRKLIANGFSHDVSKFNGIEFEFMATGGTPAEEENSKLKLKLAIHHHQRTNFHHPESWPAGIKNMPDVYLAEFCCDIKARSEEFGTNLKEWIDNTATVKFNFTKSDDVYKNIMRFIDMICEKPFEEVK